jgi:uncharacterized membrane-anchored protein YitT (DUF2179 family)
MYKQVIKNLLLIAVGSVLMAFSMTMFFIPNKIAPGGFSGLGTVFYHLFHWPAGLVVFLMDLPIFLIAWKRYGTSFVLYSLYAVAVCSVFTDYVAMPVITHDIMLASIFGGIVQGFGLGLVIKAGGNTGGTALLGQLLHTALPRMNLAWMIFAVDCLVVLFSAAVFGVEISLFAFVALYVSSKMLDMVLEGMSSAKSIYIITEHADEIAQKVLYEMERGATNLSAKGMYSGEPKDVLLVVLQSSGEVIKLKETVREIDPDAFVLVMDAREVLGEGFTPPASH